MHAMISNAESCADPMDNSIKIFDSPRKKGGGAGEVDRPLSTARHPRVAGVESMLGNAESA